MPPVGLDLFRTWAGRRLVLKYTPAGSAPQTIEVHIPDPNQPLSSWKVTRAGDTIDAPTGPERSFPLLVSCAAALHLDGPTAFVPGAAIRNALAANDAAGKKVASHTADYLRRWFVDVLGIPDTDLTIDGQGRKSRYSLLLSDRVTLAFPLSAAEEFPPRMVSLQAREVGPELRYLPGGAFMMGGPSELLAGRADERPPHLVRLSPFFIGTQPTTRVQWRTFIGGLRARAHFRERALAGLRDASTLVDTHCPSSL